VLKPVLASLRARSPQHGMAVRGVARLRRSAKRLDARLVRRGTTLGRRVMRKVPRGRVRMRVALNRSGRALLARKHRLRLTLRVTATPYIGVRGSRAVRVTLTG
jgi:hypothetical protein